MVTTKHKPTVDTQKEKGIRAYYCENHQFTKQIAEGRLEREMYIQNSQKTIHRIAIINL